MLLALDIGNSAAKGGLFDGPDLTDVFTVSTDANGIDTSDPDAWADALHSHLHDTPVQRVGLASVVPTATEAITDALRRSSDTPIVQVRPTMPLPFSLAYETPDTLGTDRLAAAAAGWVQHGTIASSPQSVVVVDAGTAVTCEVVHRDGIYLGGVIGAGPVLVRQALKNGTAQLPDVPLSLPNEPVGRSTQSALQSGIMWGLVDSVHGMIDRLAGTLPDSPHVVLTGGWGSLLADHLDRIDHHAPHLVLEGIRILVTETFD